MSASKSVHLSDYNEFLILKNYSQRTIHSYMRFVGEFLDYCKEVKKPSLLFENYVRSFLLKLQARGMSWSSINGYYSAIKILCVKVLRKEWNVDHLPRAKTAKKLPRILSQNEVVRLIESPRSLKHRMIIMLMYATGLRISEVLHLRLCDIDSDRNEIYVNQGKGAKDRIVRVPSKLIDILRVYYKRYRPKEYLFEGQGGSVKYSESSIRKIIIRARSKSKISKHVSPHSLRHCYATHHLECGTDIVFCNYSGGHADKIKEDKEEL